MKKSDSTVIKVGASVVAGIFVVIVIISYISDPLTEEDCLASGGKWGVVYYGGPEICNLPTSDGGKECTDSSQCESWCEAKEDVKPLSHDNIGTCYEKQFSTCRNTVEDGAVKGMLCS